MSLVYISVAGATIPNEAVRGNFPLDPFAWVRADALVDLDFANGRYFYDGDIFYSLAAMATAGFWTGASALGGLVSLAGISMPSAFTLCASAVNPDPQLADGRFLVVVDDGADGVTTDERAAIIQSTTSGTRYNLLTLHAGSVSQSGGATPFVRSTNGTAAGSLVNAAARFQLNNLGMYVNGGSSGADNAATMPTGLSRICCFIGGDGANAFTGTPGRITLISGAKDDATLATLAPAP